jgi:catechol 2,3-dioxygenase-like lactoylglutathione lyase family enzyme
MPTPQGVHHVTLTVTDLERSSAWYQRVLNIDKVADRSGDGWTRVLLRTASGFMIGLTEHDATANGDRFDPTVVGLDHLSIACSDRDGIEAWAAHLDDLGVQHSGVIDAAAGSLLVVEDPDGIPIEFFAST